MRNLSHLSHDILCFNKLPNSLPAILVMPLTAILSSKLTAGVHCGLGWGWLTVLFILLAMILSALLFPVPAMLLSARSLLKLPCVISVVCGWSVIGYTGFSWLVWSDLYMLFHWFTIHPPPSYNTDSPAPHSSDSLVYAYILPHSVTSCCKVTGALHQEYVMHVLRLSFASLTSGSLINPSPLQQKCRQVFKKSYWYLLTVMWLGLGF